MDDIHQGCLALGAVHIEICTNGPEQIIQGGRVLGANLGRNKGPPYYNPDSLVILLDEFDDLKDGESRDV